MHDTHLEAQRSSHNVYTLYLVRLSGRATERRTIDLWGGVTR